MIYFFLTYIVSHWWLQLFQWNSPCFKGPEQLHRLASIFWQIQQELSYIHSKPFMSALHSYALHVLLSECQCHIFTLKLRRLEERRGPTHLCQVKKWNPSRKMKCVAWFVFKNFRAVARYFLVPTCAFFTNCSIGLFFVWVSQISNLWSMLNCRMVFDFKWP